MPDVSNPTRLEPSTEPGIGFTFEGRALMAVPGDSVAAALLAAGFVDFRDTAVTGTARGPFCMMGACFDCLVQIDGAPNCQACMVEVTEGLEVRRMRGKRPVAESNDEC